MVVNFLKQFFVKKGVLFLFLMTLIIGFFMVSPEKASAQNALTCNNPDYNISHSVYLANGGDATYVAQACGDSLDKVEVFRTKFNTGGIPSDAILLGSKSCNGSTYCKLVVRWAPNSPEELGAWYLAARARDNNGQEYFRGGEPVDTNQHPTASITDYFSIGGSVATHTDGFVGFPYVVGAQGFDNNLNRSDINSMALYRARVGSPLDQESSWKLYGYQKSCVVGGGKDCEVGGTWIPTQEDIGEWYMVVFAWNNNGTRCTGNPALTSNYGMLDGKLWFSCGPNGFIKITIRDTSLPPYAEPTRTYSEISGLVGWVFIDTNRNGRMDPSEVPVVQNNSPDSPLSEVSVNLSKQGTSRSATAIFASGIFYFENLPTGSYALTFTPPAGYASTTPNPVSVVIDAYQSANKILLGIGPIGGPTNTPVPTTPTGNCTLRSRGDANCDGKVNTDDFNIWRDGFLKVVLSKQSDFNNDGVINTDDFNIWRDGFLNTSIPH